METLRFLARPAGVSFSVMGWAEPNPIALSLVSAMLALLNILTTLLARTAESSQLEKNVALWIGILSVWPST